VTGSFRLLGPGDMALRFKLQHAVVADDDGEQVSVDEIVVLTKEHERMEYLGLTLGEAKALLLTLGEAKALLLSTRSSPVRLPHSWPHVCPARAAVEHAASKIGRRSSSEHDSASWSWRAHGCGAVLASTTGRHP
jgi:hypothetical protein